MTRPSRHFRRSCVILAAFALTLPLTGCGGKDKDDEEIVGVIVDVQGRGNDVRSFTLQTAAETYEIRILPDADYGFHPSHLRVHESDLLPVRCKIERREGRLYALEILDV